MRYKIKIRGTSPLIMHNGAAGLDTRSPANVEKAAIAKKRGSNRTEADDARIRELECQTSLWLNKKNEPTIPATALRGMLEESARKLKQGPQVREGLIVDYEIQKFEYDKNALGSTPDELGVKAQFTVPVVVQRARILRTRAKFDTWAVTFFVECDEEQVDEQQLRRWLEIGGSRVGIGDWRPSKSGFHGRFETASVEKVKEKK